MKINWVPKNKTRKTTVSKKNLQKRCNFWNNNLFYFLEHSENTYDNAGGDSSPANSEISSRRQSQLAARFRSKRAESVKNDHVFFADEFQDQDLKFTPHLDDPETESQPEVLNFTFWSYLIILIKWCNFHIVNAVYSR